MKKICAVFLFISFSAAGQTTINKDLEWKTLDQPEYTVQYPSNWELNQNKLMGTIFIILSPLESPQDKFRENVNLIIQDLTGYGIDLGKFVEISEGQIKTMITNSVLIENKRVKNGSIEYQKVIYSGDQGILHLQFEQYYWVVNDKAYILTYTAGKEQFESFKPSAEKILNSFLIKNK